MSKEKDRGLGDNSKIDVEDYLSLNPVNEDLLKKINDLLLQIASKVWKASSYHAASHGDTYHFRDELNKNGERGVVRKPNNWEKTKFASQTDDELSEANKMVYDIRKLLRERGTKDE